MYISSRFCEFETQNTKDKLNDYTMGMGDKGFYFGLRHFNFSDAKFRREGKRGKNMLVKHIGPVVNKTHKKRLIC
jgi:hypothetical protein